MAAIGDHLTNDEILAEIGARLRARRLERDVTIEDAAAAAGLGRKAILKAERGGDIYLSTLIKILRTTNSLGALDAALPDTLPGSEAFSARGRVRQRASGSRGMSNKRRRKTLL